MFTEAVFRTNWQDGFPVIPLEEDRVVDLEFPGLPIPIVPGYSNFNTRNIHPNSQNVLICLYFNSEADKDVMKSYMDFVKDLPNGNGDQE